MTVVHNFLKTDFMAPSAKGRTPVVPPPTPGTPAPLPGVPVPGPVRPVDPSVANPNANDF